jgi:hypothetical protein
MFTRKVTVYDGGTEEQATHDAQHTVGIVVAAETVIALFVYPELVTVQLLPAIKFSCPAQLSYANLYSYVPAGRERVVSHTPSAFASVSG